MNEEAQGVMEEEILAEENAIPKERQTTKINAQQPPPKKKKTLQELARDWFYKLKAPKPISYVILCSLIIIIYTGLLLLSGKRPAQSTKSTVSNNAIASPSPSVDPQVKAWQDKVSQFTDYIDYINSQSRTFTPPNVDLNINFTGK